MDATYQHILQGRNGAYRIREITAREREQFNDFIRHAPLGNVYQTYEWGELKRSSGWLPRRLVLESEKGIIGAATVMKRRYAGLTMLYSPRGPVFDYENPEMIDLFCKGIAPLAQLEQAAFWRLDPELSRAVCLDAFTDCGLRPVRPYGPFGGIQPRRVWRIKLNSDSEAQWMTVKKGCRRQVNKARQNGIETREGTKSDLPEFYRLLKETAQRDGFMLRRVNYYEQLWQHLYPTHKVKMYFASRNGRPLAAALNIAFGAGVWDIYAGCSDEGGRIGASYLLTWELINQACREGYTFYDLGGIAPQAGINEKLGGLKFFKSRFGGEEVEFAGEFDLVTNPLTYRLWNWGRSGYDFLRGRGRKRRRHPLHQPNI